MLVLLPLPETASSFPSTVVPAEEALHKAALQGLLLYVAGGKLGSGNWA